MSSRRKTHKPTVARQDTPDENPQTPQSPGSPDAPNQASHSKRLPEPRRYVPERVIAELMDCPSLQAFRRRPASAKPPHIEITPRTRMYDIEEYYAWMASRPRSR